MSRTKGLRLPADFESQRKLVFVADKLADGFPEVLVDIVEATRNHTELLGLVSSSQRRDTVLRVLAENGLAADSIRLIRLPSDTMWVRDFGPVFVRSADHGILAFDFDYARRSGDHAREHDDSAGAELAQHLNVPFRRVPLEIEQGDLLSNGGELLVTTTRLFNNNISHGYDAPTIQKCLRSMFGCTTIVVLEPLRRETTGHVDVFACLTDSRTIVVGKYQESVDLENARVLDRNAVLLSSVCLAEGALRVVRLAMPGNDDDTWRTYTNVVFANGTLLVPQYGGANSAHDISATGTFQELLPDWKIAGVDASTLIAQEGALRCVTLSFPTESGNGGRR